MERTPSGQVKAVAGADYRLTAAAEAALAATDRRIVVTGAGGWLGKATLELLHNALGERFAGRIQAFGSTERTIDLRGGVTIRQRPLDAIGQLACEPTIVLHLAFLTKDRVAAMDAAAYEAANAALSRTVLDALDPIGAEAVFVASSGAARAAHDPHARHDMRLYGRLKLRDEEDFATWAARSGGTAVIARIFNVAGPYINKHDAYALAGFIRDALAARPIEVRAPHRVVRGFVAIRELMSLVFLLLLDDEGGVTRFDTGGHAMELADVARAVADALGPVAVRRAAIVSGAEDHYVGDATAYDRLRARYAIDTVPLARQIRETAESFVAAVPGGL